VLIGAGQFELAQETIAAALNEHPGHVEFSYLLSQALIAQSRFQEAAKILNEQRAAAPESFLPLLGLVDVHWEESDEKALATAEEAAERIPADYPWGKYELAVKLLHVSGGEPLARKLLEEASNSLPSNTSR
jgi:predicted Zn-dependent protease